MIKRWIPWRRVDILNGINFDTLQGWLKRRVLKVNVLIYELKEEISMNEKINETIETYIRPLLKAHGGDMEVLSFS